MAWAGLSLETWQGKKCGKVLGWAGGGNAVRKEKSENGLGLPPECLAETWNGESQERKGLGGVSESHGRNVGRKEMYLFLLAEM